MTAVPSRTLIPGRVRSGLFAEAGWGQTLDVIRAKWAEIEAAKRLSAAGIESPPTSPDVVAAANAIPIRRGVRVPGSLLAHWDPVTGEIRIAAGLEARLERFPICHELGHALLAHGTACDGFGEPSAEDFPLDEADTGIDYESEASYFAACLLVPKEWLRRDVTAGRGMTELMERYQVARTTLLLAAKSHRLLWKLKP